MKVSGALWPEEQGDIIILTSSKKSFCFFPMSRTLPWPHFPSQLSHHHLHLTQSCPFLKDLLDYHPLGYTFAPSSFRGCLPFLIPPARWIKCGALTQIVFTVFKVMGMNNNLLLGSDMGHKFQPVLLIPIFALRFPSLFAHILLYQSPVPPHSHRPQRHRLSPSSPRRAPHEAQGLNEHACTRSRVRWETGESTKAKSLRSPSQQCRDNFSQLLPIIFKLFLNHVVSRINGAHFLLVHR